MNIILRTRKPSELGELTYNNKKFYNKFNMAKRGRLRQKDAPVQAKSKPTKANQPAAVRRAVKQAHKASKKPIISINKEIDIL